MAYRDRQKISQMTPKGANLEATDLIEVSTVESGSYVTKSITGQEIIDSVSGTTPNLQQVTDEGNTTDIDIIVTDGIDSSQISTQGIIVTNGISGTYSAINYDGSIALKAGTQTSGLANINVTNPNVSLEFPNKASGSYTIATTSDLTNGTVTSVGLTAGTGISVSGSPITSSGSITVTNSAPDQVVAITAGTGIGVTGTYPNFTVTNSAPSSGGTVTSVGLSMPSAFNVSNSPVTSSGTLTVTGAGSSNQYVRGDGSLGIFPTVGGGGGGSVYYLNGNTSQGSIGGTTMYQLSKLAASGTTANFTRSTTGTIASFITDAGDPNQLTIPSGIWLFEIYFSESGGGSNHATVQAIVEKWNGTSITVIGTGVVEEITNGNVKDLYTLGVSIPSGVTLSLSDRIVIQIQIANANGKTVTLYTENGNISSVTTTFANGISSINGLTAAAQTLGVGTSGTDFGINSTGSTHTFNLPTASATNRGALSTTDWSEFNAKASYTPRVQSVTSASTVTPVNTNDLVKITAQAAALALANPTGTWDEGQPLMIRIKDNGTARAITYDTNYRAIGVTLPTTTVISKTTYLGLIYNATDTKWDVIGVTTQA